VLHQELRAALYGMSEAPQVHGYLSGVGGVNVSAERIAAFVQQALSTPALAESEWVR
jgi:pyruvate ferredoxin oxidoreductase alpha subunit